MGEVVGVGPPDSRPPSDVELYEGRLVFYGRFVLVKYGSLLREIIGKVA